MKDIKIDAVNRNNNESVIKRANMNMREIIVMMMKVHKRRNKIQNRKNN